MAEHRNTLYNESIYSNIYGCQRPKISAAEELIREKSASEFPADFQKKDYTFSTLFFAFWCGRLIYLLPVLFVPGNKGGLQKTKVAFQK
jgi:hypothetical protein